MNLSWYATKNNPGWFTVVGDSKDVRSIRRSGVQQDPMAGFTNEVVVPAWVIDAIKAYRSNEGYADMDIGEFLKRMGGDFKAKK